MAGVIPKFVHGPVTYKVTGTVRGGRLVEAVDGGTVQEAAAGSLKVLGVATKDAKEGGSTFETADEFGNPVYSMVEVTEYVAVGNPGYWPVQYAAAAEFGEALIAAADGTVTPAGATPDPLAVIGYCAEPDGVAEAGPGLAKINR